MSLQAGMTTYETWSVWLGAVLACLTAGGLGGVIYQVRLAAKAQRLDNIRRCEQATLEFYAGTMQGRVNWRQCLPDDRDGDAIAAFVQDPADLTHPTNKLVSEYLNYFESLATGVNLRIYDLDTIDHIAGPRLIATYRNYLPWIEGRRAVYNQRVLYSEWELLVATLVERRRNDPVRGEPGDVERWGIEEVAVPDGQLS